MDKDPECFPEKPNRFFPLRTPPYFSAITSFQAISAFRMTSLSSLFYAEKNAAKLHGFFPVKTARSQKHRFKERIVQRSWHQFHWRLPAPFGPATLRRRKDHGRGHVWPKPPFIKGASCPGEAAGYRACGFV